MLVSQFLTDLKARGQYQAAQTVLSDADFMRFANRQLQMVICPKIMSLRQNYFAGQKDYTLTTSRRYRLPPRILGDRVQTVKIISGSEQFILPVMPNTDGAATFRNGYYVSQGDIILTGTIPSGTMRVIYGIRPPNMSATAVAIGTVATVTATGFTVSYSTGLTAYQAIRQGSPYRTISPAIATNTGNGVDSDCTTDYQRFQVGDIVIVQNTTHIVPLEDELCDWLLQRTHMRVLQSLGQTNELQAAGSKLADQEKDIMALLSPRTQNSPKTIYNGQLMGWRD